jgi:hypothetical protein
LDYSFFFNFKKILRVWRFFGSIIKSN